MKKIIAYICICLASLTAARAQSAAVGGQETLLVDSAVLIGRLPNGITYYIRHNGDQPRRAGFYLIRNAGSLLETDEQNGLAHFLEHMAFQGTKHFPGKGIISGLEKHGVAFGSNINAYTSHNETVYQLTDVPTQSESLLDTCLLILHDWSYYLSLEEKEIDAERKVIVEEWRTRRTSTVRMQEKTNQVLYQGSRYADRDVIGTLDVIQHFAPQALRDFYHRWYRTDLEAIAIVGDFDARRMEEKVKKLFTAIPAVKNPEPRPFFSIPDNDTPRYVLATDNEAARSSLGLSIRMNDTPACERNRVAYLRESLIISFFNSMMRTRIAELARRPDTPFRHAEIAYGDLVRGYCAYNVNVSPRPGQEAAAWEAAMTENERVKRYGFTPEELERAKKDMLTALENGRRKGKANSRYAQEIQAHFLEGRPLLSPSDYYRWVKRLVADITVEEVSVRAKKWNSPKNRTLLVVGSAKEKHLSREDMTAIMERVEHSGQIRPYAVNTPSGVQRKLLDDAELQGGQIVKVRSLERFGAVEWTLQNGARVVFRHSASNKILVSSYSNGGTSVYEDTDLLPAAENAATMVSSFGVGDFTPDELRTLLTGKRVGCKVNITPWDEAIGGSSVAEDFETLMQLIYLRFEKPRFDEALFATLMQRNYAALQQYAGQPQTVMKDSLQQILHNYSSRFPAFNKAYLDKITLERLKYVYSDRIKDASDFVFFIMGNLKEENARQMVEKYIGSLRSEHRKEKRTLHRELPAKGKVVKNVRLNWETPKATVVTNFSTKLKNTPYHNICQSLLRGILQLRYTENIREKEGGTYGININATSSRLPESRYSFTMIFDCAPEREAHLKSLVHAETERLAEEAPGQDEFAKVVANLRKNDEQSRNSDAYWMAALAAYYTEGIDITAPENFDRILERLTPADIHKFAKKMFKESYVIDLTFQSK